MATGLWALKVSLLDHEKLLQQKYSGHWHNRRKWPCLSFFEGHVDCWGCELGSVWYA